MRAIAFFLGFWLSAGCFAKNVFILSGPPGSGKTSVLLYLESKGRKIIREAQTDIAYLDIARGVKNPFKEVDFEMRAIDLFNSRSQPYHNLSEAYESVFCDRFPLETLFYVQMFKKEVPEEFYTKYEEFKKHPFFEKNKLAKIVFYLESLEKLERSSTRRESEEQAQALSVGLKKLYEDAGFTILHIPRGTVEERGEKILLASRETAFP